MNTDQQSPDPAVTPVVIHYSDYLWESQIHLMCKRPWANGKWTDKKLIEQCIFNSDYGVYTTDKDKVTCEACKAKMNN